MTQHDEMAAVILPFKQAAQFVANPVVMLMRDLLLPDLLDVITPELPLIYLDPLNALAGATDTPTQIGEPDEVSERRAAPDAEPHRSRASGASVRQETAHPLTGSQPADDVPVFPLRRRKGVSPSTEDTDVGGMRASSWYSEEPRSQIPDDYPGFSARMTGTGEGFDGEPAAQVQAITTIIGELADDLLRQTQEYPLHDSDAAPALYPDAERRNPHGTSSPQIVSMGRTHSEDESSYLTQQPALSRIAALVDNVDTEQPSSPMFSSQGTASQAATATVTEMQPFQETGNVPEPSIGEQPYNEMGSLANTELTEQQQPIRSDLLYTSVGHSLDPETLAALVNEALVEQARRYGVDFP